MNARGEAMEVAEAARETAWAYPSFAGELFLGRFRLELIHPYPESHPADKKVGDELLGRVEAFLKEKVDADAIDATGELPPEVIDGLKALGLFGMKIGKEYGGLGLSQTNYNRVVALIASHCASTAVWLSAHQSIGVPQPLKLVGTPEQKKKYLPRLAAGAISAFALTEPEVGSDPARMTTTATPSEDGRYLLLNGEKLWCTNGPVAEILIVMARTPDRMVNGRAHKQITAFIVEKDMPGFEVVHRCRFMGLNGIQNGLLRFTNVRVPRENILGAEGQGLKLALTTLNTGRLTLPAACVAAGKACLNISRWWANARVQWGAPIGRHEAIAEKLARHAADVFAMEAVTELAAALVDRGGVDIRLEAALAKLFGSEASWRIIDETLQIRGGRGYETGPSLAARGEPGLAVERMLRDARINTLIEGSSEILRLFIAREALDPHLRVAGALLDPRAPLGKKLAALTRMAGFYLRWYPRQWLYAWPLFRYAPFGTLQKHLRFCERASHRLARTIFHLMLRYRAGLERRQLALGRVVDIGQELFAMAAACSRALALTGERAGDDTPFALADLYCRGARRRVRAAFAALWCNDDRAQVRAARRFLEGDFEWLEAGIVKPMETKETGA